MAGLTHFDDNGKANMIDVHEKQETVRKARAKGSIYVTREIFDAVKGGTAEKGDVLGIARVAGIMATKKSPELIPLCHPIALTKSGVEFTLYEDELRIEAECTASCVGRTGIEMEVLTGVTVALLTIYDMCKGLSQKMRISDVRLVEKEGGKSGHYIAEE